MPNLKGIGMYVLVTVLVPLHRLSLFISMAHVVKDLLQKVALPENRWEDKQFKGLPIPFCCYGSTRQNYCQLSQAMRGMQSQHV